MEIDLKNQNLDLTQTKQIHFYFNSFSFAGY